MYTCIYFIYLCINICMYIYMYTYMCMYMPKRYRLVMHHLMTMCVFLLRYICTYICTYIYTSTLSNAYATHWYVYIYVYTYAHVYGSTRMLLIASDAPPHYKGTFCDSMYLALCDGVPGGLNYLWGLNTLNTIVECCLKDPPPPFKNHESTHTPRN